MTRLKNSLCEGLEAGMALALPMCLGLGEHAFERCHRSLEGIRGPQQPQGFRISC